MLCLMTQNRHYLNALCHCCSRKAWAASAQSFTLWQQATMEITSSLFSSPLASTINCSLASQALSEVTHQDHSIGITLLLLVRATYIWPDGCYSLRTSRSWWIAHSTQCQLTCCNTTLGPVMLMKRKFDIFCKLDISRTQPHHHRGALVGLGFQNKAPKFPSWNRKHYKTVMFVQILECQDPLHKCKASYRRLSGDGYVGTLRFSLAIYLVTLVRF